MQLLRRAWFLRMLAVVAMLLPTAAVFAQFSGSGTGTASDPYKIFNPNQVAQVKNFVNQSGVYFELMADVDMESWISKNSPTDGWAPIGTSVSPFKGVFKGNNHTIKGLTINRPTTDNVGFFGYLSGATISDLALEINVAGQNNVGGLAGYATTSTLTNISVKGDIIGRGEKVGGLIGSLSDTKITDCKAESSVTGTTQIGGLIGYAIYSATGGTTDSTPVTKISGCEVYGKVTATKKSADAVLTGVAGGLIGDAKASISNVIFGSYGSSASQTDKNKANTNYYNIISIVDCRTKIEVRGGDITAGLIGGITNGSSLNQYYDYYNNGYRPATGSGYSHLQFIVSNCSAAGTVTATGERSGGLIGAYLNSGAGSSITALSKSFFIGNVEGGEATGGCIGYSGSVLMSMDNCYSCGLVKGTKYVGGIIGNANGMVVDKCYTSANITGTQYVAGIVGGCSDNTRIVKSCVVLSEYINASTADAHRVTNMSTAGENGTPTANKGSVETMVSAGGETVSTADSEYNGESLSLEMLKMRATYQGIGWNFTNDWAIQETESFPYNKEQTAPPVITSDIISGAVMLRGKCISGGKVTVEIGGERFEADCDNTNWSMRVNPLKSGELIRVYAQAPDKAMSYFVSETVRFPGSGTEDDPYLIYTVSDLQNIGGEYFYKLMNDLDLSEIHNWTPIGTLKASVASLDGDNHTIKGLTINRTSENTGLIANASNATIRNLNIVGANVKGGNASGILVGNASNVTLENITISGSIEGTSYVGAVAGKLDGGALNVVSTQATVAGSNYIGGLTGSASAATTIRSCSVGGTVEATAGNAYVGGIVAENYGTIADSFVTADISATGASTDGFLGGVAALNYGTIQHCYASGLLSGQRRAAGISGYNDGAAAVTTGCVAANSKIVLSSENPIGMRVVGGTRNGAPLPATDDNIASEQMILSFNDIPQDVYDDPFNGLSKPSTLLKEKSTYTVLGWDFAKTWRIGGDAMPQLQATATGGGDATGYDNYLSIAPFLTYGGEQVRMPIVLTNRDKVSGLQFDMVLPAGITIAKDEDDYLLIDKSDRAGRQHELNYQEQPDGSVRVLIYSSTGRYFTGNDGDIAYVTLNFDNSLVNGQYNIQLKNVFLSDEMATNIVGPVTFGSVKVLNDWMDAGAVQAMRGKKGQLSVEMHNRSQISGYQFDLRLPQGVTIATNGVGEPDLTFGDRSSASRHTVALKERPEDGTTRIVVYSLSNQLFTGNEGTAMTINLAVDEEMEPADYKLEFTNVYLVDPASRSIQAPDFAADLTVELARRKGDVNLDGIINVADANGTVAFMHGKDTSHLDLYAADLDDNGQVLTNDFNGVITMILNESIHAPSHPGIRAAASTPVTPNLHYFIEPFTIQPGQEKELLVMLDNPGRVVGGSQFDILLPEGLEMVLWDDPLDEDDFWMEVGSRTNKRQFTSLVGSHQPGGWIRMSLLSMVHGAVYKDEHGDVLKIAVRAKEDAVPGVYDVKMQHMYLSNPEAENLHAPDYVTTVVIGDLPKEELSLKGRMSDHSMGEFNGKLAAAEAMHTLDISEVANLRSDLALPFASANPNMLIWANDSVDVHNDCNVVRNDEVAFLRLKADYPFAVKSEITAQKAELTLTATVGEKVAAIIPFEVSASELPEAMTCTGYSTGENAFKFAPVESPAMIAANTPVLFTSETYGDFTISADNVTIAPFAVSLDAKQPVLTGTYVALTPEIPCYGLVGNLFSSTTEMQPFGVYAVGADLLTSPAMMLDATGIEAVEADALPADAEIYNLQGVRVTEAPNRLRPGLYIINGRKVHLPN